MQRKPYYPYGNDPNPRGKGVRVLREIIKRNIADDPGTGVYTAIRLETQLHGPEVKYAVLLYYYYPGGYTTDQIFCGTRDELVNRLDVVANGLAVVEEGLAHEGK